MSRLFAIQTAELRSVIGFAVGVLFSLALPVVLVRHLSPADLSIWMLGLSIGMFLQWLAFELQPQTAEQTLRASQSNNPQYSDWLFGALKFALKIGVGFAASAVMLSALFFVIAKTGSLDPPVARRLTFLSLIGASYGLSVPFALAYGVWQGEGRSERVPLFRACLQCGFMLAAVVASVLFGTLDLWSLGLLWIVTHAVALILICQLLFRRASRDCWGRRIAVLVPSCVSNRSLLRGGARQLVFAFWVVIDVWLVAFVDSFAVGGYQIAALVAGILVNAQWALSSAQLSKYLTSGSPESKAANRNLWSRHQTVSLLLSALGCLFVGLVPGVVWTWLFKSTAPQVWAVIVPLTLAAALRATLFAHTQLCIATGIQTRFAPLAYVDFFLKLTLCGSMGFFWGVNGVAWGAFVASALGLIAYVHRSLDCAQEVLDVNAKAFIWPRQKLE